MKIFLVLLLSFFTFSCSNEVQKKKDVDISNTLRYKTEALIKNTVWTEQLEKGRLETSNSKYGNISEYLSLRKISILADVSDSSKLDIFPFIEGFGFLDLSLFPSDLYPIVKEVSNNLVKNKNLDSFMAEDCLYSLGLFYLNLKKMGINRNEFNSYLIGSAFITEFSYEIPIRLFCNKEKTKFLDINLFFLNEKKTWKIDQIQISKYQ